jgi:hypothetical protein
MKTLRKRMILTVFISTAIFTLLTSAGMAADINKMTKEELKKIMGEDTVTILDVRTGRDWSSSEFKIKGADRVNPKEFDTWSNKYPKDTTLVLYCA